LIKSSTKAIDAGQGSGLDLNAISVCSRDKRFIAFCNCCSFIIKRFLFVTLILSINHRIYVVIIIYPSISRGGRARPNRPYTRCIDRTTPSSRRGYPRGIADALQASRVGLVSIRTIVPGCIRVSRVSCVS
jgi:hypothetical protein